MFLGHEVDDEIANLMVAQLLLLEADDPDRDIALYINSPGGSAYAGMAIYDAMQHVRPDVSTICFGMGMSAAAMIMAGGAAGKRFALPNAKLMIHQGSAGFRGAPSDIQIAAREVAATTRRMAEIIGRHSGRDIEHRDGGHRSRSVHDAGRGGRYGLIDAILPPPLPGDGSSIGGVDPSGIHHVGIAVPDLDEAVATYAPPVRRHPRASGVRLRPGCRGGLRARRRQPDRAARTHGRGHARGPLPREAGQGVHHLAYEVDDVGVALAGLAADGVELIDHRPARWACSACRSPLSSDAVLGVLTEVVSVARAI